MMTLGRRAFLQFLGSSALTAALPTSIERALAIPAHQRNGTIEDVEHIVILMQENRAFDHYFGTLRGVRGFGDPRAVVLPSGRPVWFQPDGKGFVLPFHPTAPDLGLQFLEDTPHGWTDTHAAWNDGKYDQWIPNKGTSTMAYLTRADIPDHYALAAASFIYIALSDLLPEMMRRTSLRRSLPEVGLVLLGVLVGALATTVARAH